MNSALSAFSILQYNSTNNISGNVSSFTSLYNFYVDYVNGSNTGTLLLPNATNLHVLARLQIGCIQYTSEQENQILADFWANRDYAKPGTTLRQINLNGATGSGAPTGQGLVDEANLKAYRSPNNEAGYNLWTVTRRQ